jgi:hypothetical protein
MPLQRNTGSADFLNGVALLLSVGTLLWAFVLHRRRPDRLTAALSWLGVGLTLGSVKQFLAPPGSPLWVALLGLSVLCSAFAVWHLMHQGRD